MQVDASTMKIFMYIIYNIQNMNLLLKYKYYNILTILLVIILFVSERKFGVIVIFEV